MKCNKHVKEKHVAAIRVVETVNKIEDEIRRVQMLDDLALLSKECSEVVLKRSTFRRKSILSARKAPAMTVTQGTTRDGAPVEQLAAKFVAALAVKGLLLGGMVVL